MSDAEMGEVVDCFLEGGSAMRSCLEMGTLRWTEGKPTTVAREWFPNLEPDLYVRSDITDGEDVDITADAHDLRPFLSEMFDLYIARSVWEHLPRPWLAAHAAFRVLRSGGLAFIDVPQTFPLHGYPYDYFRFSTNALTVVMQDAGFDIVIDGYVNHCKVIADEPIEGWNRKAPAWLNAQILARKP